MATKKATKTTRAPKTAPVGEMAGDQTANQAVGEKADPRARNLRSGVTERVPSDDVGDRETREPDEGDKVWTSDSKPRWGEDQPSLADQLKSQMRIDQGLSAEVETADEAKTDD